MNSHSKANGRGLAHRDAKTAKTLLLDVEGLFLWCSGHLDISAGDCECVAGATTVYQIVDFVTQLEGTTLFSGDIA
jgi:hypothetical protein